MKRIQKMLSILLVCCMLCSVMPISAQAAVGGTCGSNVSWELVDDTLTISGSGIMLDYWEYAPPWEGLYFTEVVIESGVTYLGAAAFVECEQLKKVSIAGSVEIIGDSAFTYCYNLEEVQFSEGLSVISDYAFECCESLKNIDLPDSLVRIGLCAFDGCNSLTSVTIPKNVQVIDGNPFAYCDRLAAFFVVKENPYFCNDAEGILYTKDKKELLAYPSALAGPFTVPGGVEIIGDSAFAYNENLTALTISEGTRIIKSEAFIGCENLNSVSFPNTLEMIYGYAFAHCWSLESIVIPEGVTSLGGYAFSYCTNLTSVQIPNSLQDPSGSDFAGCESLLEIRVKDNHPTLSNDAQGVLYNKDKTNLNICPGGRIVGYEFPESVIRIAPYAFADSRNLTELTLPERIEYIGAYAFSNSYLRNITLPDSMLIIGVGAFAFCDDLSYVEMPKNLSELRESAFLGCSSLRSIVIPQGVKALALETFLYCERLTSVTIPTSVTSIGYSVFAECTNLKDIYYTGTQEQWYSVKKEYGAYHPDTKIHFNATGPVIKADHDCPGLRFLDTPGADSWAHEGIDYCLDNWLMNGTSDYLFNPGGTVTRAQLVTILYRAAGSPWIDYQGTFTDVPEGMWYTEAVEWAAAEGVVNGIGGGKFAPDQNITREQIATILHRFSGQSNVNGNLNAFPDQGNVSGFAKEAMIWATSNGLINGINANGVTNLAPKANATREQIASIIMRFIESYYDY